MGGKGLRNAGGSGKRDPCPPLGSPPFPFCMWLTTSISCPCWKFWF